MTKRAVLAKLSRRDFVTGAAMSVATSAMGWRLAQAQAAFPSRLITVISPFAPGGLNDICSRAVAKGLQEGFRQMVAVDNRPGGDTLIVLGQVARSAPDGHMPITVSDLNMTFLPTLASKLSFSIERDFAPVTLLCVVPFLLLVRAGLDVNSAGDVIALAKGSPETVLRICRRHVRTTHGGRTVQVVERHQHDARPYRGAALAITDVMAGHVDLMFADMGSAASLVKAGKVRAIGISVDQRAAAFQSCRRFRRRSTGLRRKALD
jgi:tripartite-type tricarboxylate transporter receptor subunit TctC